MLVFSTKNVGCPALENAGQRAYFTIRSFLTVRTPSTLLATLVARADSSGIAAPHGRRGATTYATY